MALTKACSKTIYGKTLDFPNAYIQITNQNGDKNNILLGITVYDNSNKNNVIDTDSYVFVPDVTDTATNFIKQGYAQLKANKYIGATDVLEDGQMV